MGCDFVFPSLLLYNLFRHTMVALFFNKEESPNTPVLKKRSTVAGNARLTERSRGASRDASF